MAQYNDEELSFRIVLYQPEIPLNTGNIGRLCLGANAELHIIKPMRFFINDKNIKKAGLDYWEKVKLFIHDSFEDYVSSNVGSLYVCETAPGKVYTEATYTKGDSFLFGPESRGLPADILEKYSGNIINIPMTNDIRSINLCNSVAIVLYEAMRQVGCW